MKRLNTSADKAVWLCQCFPSKVRPFSLTAWSPCRHFCHQNTLYEPKDGSGQSSGQFKISENFQLLHLKNLPRHSWERRSDSSLSSSSTTLFFFFFLLSPPFSHFKTLLSPEFDQPAGRKFALSCPLQKKDSQEYPGRDLHGLKTLYLQSDLNLQSAVTLS